MLSINPTLYFIVKLIENNSFMQHFVAFYPIYLLLKKKIKFFLILFLFKF